MYSLLPLKPHPSRCRIPLFLQPVAAGFPSPAADYQEEGLDFNTLLVTDPPVTIVVRVEGESMIGVGIFPGDLLVVDRGLVARPGDVVVAAVDGEFTVKTLARREGGYVLEAENPAYPPIPLFEASELSIWGVVTSAIHRFRAADRRR